MNFTKWNSEFFFRSVKRSNDELARICIALCEDWSCNRIRAHLPTTLNILHSHTYSMDFLFHLTSKGSGTPASRYYCSPTDKHAIAVNTISEWNLHEKRSFDTAVAVATAVISIWKMMNARETLPWISHNIVYGIWKIHPLHSCQPQKDISVFILFLCLIVNTSPLHTSNIFALH